VKDDEKKYDVTYKCCKKKGRNILGCVKWIANARHKQEQANATEHK
jgi:hypothetical protein